MPKPGKLPEEPKAPEVEPQGGRIMLAFEVDNTVYRLRNGSWSWRDEMELAAATQMLGGLGYPELRTRMVTGKMSAFILGCFIFLALRGEGEQVSFEDAQARSDYDVAFEWLTTDEPEDDTSGKDQADS